MKKAIRLKPFEAKGEIDLIVIAKEGQEIPVPDLTDLKVKLVAIKGGINLTMVGDLILADHASTKREQEIYGYATLEDYTKSAVEWYKDKGFEAKAI